MVVMNRVVNEQLATDDGSVYVENARLKQRFSHVNGCPNYERYRRFWQSMEATLVPGKSVLDLGCYQGEALARYASLGPARLTGIDISPNAVKNASALGLNADVHVMDAHRMTFPDNTFDVVIGCAILHHLDFRLAVREVHRVMKPAGVAMFLEPLRGNPVGKVIRTLTPRARTPDERPLDRAQIIEANRLFASHDHRFYGLASTGLALATSIVWRSNPSNILLRIADRMDVRASRIFLKYWMRLVVLFWRK